MNNWRLGGLVNTALIVQLGAFIAILLDIPFLRQIIGFVYLLFMPGFLFLKTIRMDRIGLIENILFSAGISVMILMLYGLLSSVLYPVLNIAKPLSAFPLIASTLVLVLILYFASWLRNDRTSARGTESLSEETAVNLKSLRILPLLACIPILTILGTEMLASSGSNFLLLLLVVITSAIVLCTSSRRLVPPETYLFGVLAISFFLLFQMSLSSRYIIGYDVHLEYYLASLTSSNSIWNRAIPHEYASMLSVTVLPAVFSNFLNLDLNWVFKAVYPLIFSLVPLSLFLTYRRLTDSRIAFLSVFYFMSLEVFYFTMLGLARQMIGELFFALLILVLVEEKISLSKRRLLFTIFSLGLIVSHYALSYVFMFFILLTFWLSPFLKTDGESPKLITGDLVLRYFAMATAWYLLVAPSPISAFEATIENIYSSISAQSSPGVGGLLPTYVSPLRDVVKYLFYGLQLSIVFGLIISIISTRVYRRIFGFVRHKKIVALLSYRRITDFVRSMANEGKGKFSSEYLSMSLCSFLILILCIAVPSFAAGLEVSRFYHIATFLLAPFVVLGLLSVFGTIERGMVNLKSHLFTSEGRRLHVPDVGSRSVGLFLISMLIVAFFLFQVGFIYEVSGDRPSSLSLSWERVQTNPNLAWDVWSAQTPEQDVYSAEWLSKQLNDLSKVYADKPSSLHVLTSYGLFQTTYFSANSRVGTYDYLLSNTTRPDVHAYVYLRTRNVVYGIIEGSGQTFNTTEISPILADCDSIYSNGGSQIYKEPP
jgi:uncharacterized membrane protein